MANLPAVRKADTSTLSRQEIRSRILIVRSLALGVKPPTMAKRMAKGDKRRKAEIEWTIYNWLAQDAVLRAMIEARAHGELAAGLIEASRAVVRRAGRGKPDAIKLLFEASGFHNPRVKHDHSGEVKITIDLPRPTRSVDETGPVVDAEVVND